MIVDLRSAVHKEVDALDASRLRRELNWRPGYSFEQGLAQTVEWYRRNEGWRRKIKSGEYREYCARMYGERLCPVPAKNRPPGRSLL